MSASKLQEGAGLKRRRPENGVGEDDDETEKNYDIYSIDEEELDPIQIDDVYVKADSDCSGMKRPAFLPSNDQASEDEHAGADDYGSFGDPRAATVSVHSESGTEENAEVESCSRTSLLSDQRGRRSTWGPAKMVKGMRGPYGGGATVVLPGAETPGKGVKGGRRGRR